MLRVKLVLTVILLATSSIHATAWSQSERMTLKFENTNLVQFFQQLQKQTNLKFVFNQDDVEKYSASVDAHEKTLKEILDIALAGMPFEYTISESHIVISMRQQAERQIPSVTITGNVRDDNGRPMQGVTVMLKGSAKGAVTDLQGDFSLSIPAQDSPVLTFSFLGYRKHEATAMIGKPMNITLVEDVTSIEEVVVTGYQKLRPTETAGSTFSAKTDDIIMPSAPSVDQMLQGRIPGLMALNTSGEPSASAKIRIRGNATINGNKSPVWVVDGIIVENNVPFTASDINSEDAEYLIGNAIAGLNPQDIESITILKDASATAIYGVRAANGVIVLTTKRGRSGTPVVRYNGSMSINTRPSYSQYDRMNSQERLQFSKEIIEQGLTYRKAPIGASYEGYYQKLLNKEITQAEFEAVVNAMQTRNTDWYDILFRTEISHNHTLSVSGGGERSDYYFSAGYTESLGAAIGSSSDRYNLLAKGNFFLKEWLQLHLKFEYNSRQNDGFNGVNPQSYAYNTSRTIPAYNEDGSYHEYMIDNGYLYNVIKERNQTGSSSKMDSFGGVIGLTARILPGLSFQSTLSISNSNTQQRSWQTEYSNAVTDLRRYEHGRYGVESTFYSDSNLPYGGILNMNNTRMTGFVARNTLEYRNIFNGGHEINAFGGVEVTSTKHMGNSVTGYGWNPLYGEIFNPVYTDSFILNYVTKGKLLPFTTNKTKQIASFFGTFAYTYNNRYVLNANIRSDGSNKFGSDPKYRWLPTWSLAAKWIISNESFMENVDLFNNLSLRASYGTQGNIHDDATPNLITKYYERESTGLDVHTIEKIPNPSLRWEKTTSWNVALDFSLLHNRIRGSIDVYRKDGKDIITQKNTPASTGRTQLSINASRMRNTGIEGFIESQIIQRENFGWKLGVNFARNVNKITLSNEDSYSSGEIVDMMLAGNLAFKGDALGTIYSYNFAGLSPENGYALFWAKNREEYPDPVYFGSKDYLDLVKSGSIYPDVSGGFDTQFTFWKNLSVELAFAYSLGSVGRLPNVYDSDRYIFNPLMNVSTNLTNRWKQPGDEERTSIPALFDATLIGSYIKIEKAVARPEGGTYALPQTIYNYSNQCVASADFLKLRSITVVYRMPSKILDKVSLTGMNLRFQMTNVFTIANKKWKGLDPETSTANIPLVPVYNFSLDFTF